MRFSWLILIGLLATNFGCSWLNQPYANDPFVRKHQAVLGEPLLPPATQPWQQPTPPEPPSQTVELPKPRPISTHHQ